MDDDVSMMVNMTHVHPFARARTPSNARLHAAHARMWLSRTATVLRQAGGFAAAVNGGTGTVSVAGSNLHNISATVRGPLCGSPSSLERACRAPGLGGDLSALQSAEYLAAEPCVGACAGSWHLACELDWHQRGVP